jgi:hypothetical protein
MISSIDDLLSVRLTWTITRDTANPSDQRIARGKGEEIPLTKENKDILIQMINSTNSTQKSVKIKAAFPKFIKVSNSGKADVAFGLNHGMKMKVKIYS